MAFAPQLVSPRGVTVAVGSKAEEVSLRSKGYTPVPTEDVSADPEAVAVQPAATAAQTSAATAQTNADTAVNSKPSAASSAAKSVLSKSDK